MICVLSSIAEYPHRVEKMFKTKELNDEGIVVMELFIKGRPEVITMDDRLPYGTSAPLFLRETTDHAYWAHMAEKMFAKVNVNYEHNKHTHRIIMCTHQLFETGFLCGPYQFCNNINFKIIIFASF